MSTSLKVKPLNKITQTKPQKIRARKLENGIALKMARIAFKFKTRTIDYNTLKESVAKIGHSNLIQRCHRRQENSVQERAFHSGFLDNEKTNCKTKLHFNNSARAKKPPFNQIFFWTCFPSIRIDKNRQKGISNMKGVLYCRFNATKLPFSWRIEIYLMFSKTEPILIKYI